MKKLLTILCVSLVLTSNPAWAKFRGGGSFSSFRSTPVRVAPTPRPVTTPSTPPKVTPAPAPAPAPAPVKTPEAPRVTPVTAAPAAAAATSSSSGFWSWALPAFMLGWFVANDSDEKEKE